jgi:rare lipoprotein A (peptidoglycan hydrolase)
MRKPLFFIVEKRLAEGNVCPYTRPLCIYKTWRMNHKMILLATTVLLNGIACKQQETTIKEIATVLHTEEWIASFYGRWDGFAGKRMANGKRMHPDSLTAAHRTRAFDTQVRVIHREDTTQKADTVIVTITDRWPYAKDRQGNYSRLLDVSYAAGEKLGILKKWHAKVIAEVLYRGKKKKKKWKRRQK